MKSLFGNLITLAALIGLIWIGVKGMTYLGSRAAATSALQEGGEETSQLLSSATSAIKDGTAKAGNAISDAGKATLEKGEKVVSKIAEKKEVAKKEIAKIQKKVSKATTPPDMPDDLYDEDEIDEDLPYEHEKGMASPNASNEAAEKVTEKAATLKGEFTEKGGSATKTLAPKSKVADVKTPDTDNAEAKAKMALAEKNNPTEAKTPEARDIPKTYNTSPKRKEVKKSALPYLVVAGSFSNNKNANAEVKRLKKLGFKNAETINFSANKYVSVCAGRFQKKSNAQKLVNQLKKKKVDSYVKTKKK